MTFETAFAAIMSVALIHELIVRPILIGRARRRGFDEAIKKHKQKRAARSPGDAPGRGTGT